jgi:hypothetical protein
MQAKRRSYYAPTSDAAVAEAALAEGPSRYWGIAVIAVCTASWAAIFGAAKLLIALI